MAKYKLLLPKMGESVAEATVIKWNKNPGDYIEADDTVMEIATDKVDSDVPSPVAGKLIEQLCKDNDIVQVGAVIAIIETDEPGQITEPVTIAPVYHPVEEIHHPLQETYTAADEVQGPPADAPSRAPLEGATQQVFAEPRPQQAPPVPYTGQLEQSASPKTENTLKDPSRFYSPLVKNIAAQEGISNTELEQIPGTGAEGRLTKDDLLNFIQNKYGTAEAIKNDTGPVKEETSKVPLEPSQTSRPVPVFAIPVPEPAAETPGPGASVPEPGPVVEKPQPEPVKQEPVGGGTSLSGGDEIIEMDRMRRLIADHMVMSKHVAPHVTSFVEADVTNMVLWREKIKNSFEKREGEKITFTPIFIEAVVRSIKDMPMINIQVNGTQIIKKKDINISMATSLPSGNLIVPVIKKADELSLIGLTKAVNDLANRARTNKLKPDDIKGGTFTITNIGSFGNVMGTPIINQPQVAILAVGAIKKKPAVIETLQGDMIGIRHMMFLSLSYDHRVVDGALGGTFVRRVADYLENWDPGREI
ncbi:MAG TPA: dihydrolipoamide acetyltransferase family protein [Mucilaginibacter sp.]